MTILYYPMSIPVSRGDNTIITLWDHIIQIKNELKQLKSMTEIMMSHPTHVKVTSSGAATVDVDLYYLATPNKIDIVLKDFTFLAVNTDDLYIKLPECLTNSIKTTQPVYEFPIMRLLGTGQKIVSGIVVDLTNGILNYHNGVDVGVCFSAGYTYSLPYAFSFSFPIII